jgi:hypothetical protein
MTTVDTAKASDRARQVADESLCRCYAQQDWDSIPALVHWARVFKREFHALTQPTPYPAAALAKQGA